MGLMSALHKLLLKRGRLSDLLPDEDVFDDDAPEREAVRAEIEARAADERETRREVDAAIRRLKELDKNNHYGESLRRAFGGS